MPECSTPTSSSPSNSSATVSLESVRIGIPFDDPALASSFDVERPAIYGLSKRSRLASWQLSCLHTLRAPGGSDGLAAAMEEMMFENLLSESAEASDTATISTLPGLAHSASVEADIRGLRTRCDNVCEQSFVEISVTVSRRVARGT